MADKKISALAAATTPLAGTEVLPIVQSGSTVKVESNNLTVKNVRSNATTGILQIAGPAAAATRTMTVPDANFTAARTDAAQTFTGNQTFDTAIATNFLSNTTTTTGVGQTKLNNATALLATSGSITATGAVVGTQKYSASNNATADAFRFLQTDGSTVYGTNWQCGIFYVNVKGASGANQFSAVYAMTSLGNGTGTASLTSLHSLTRGTSPVSSVQLANDGVGGAVKLTITYIDNSGVVTGGESNVTFVGQSSLT